MPRLSLRGLEIEYLTQGDATRPPLLLLMGTGAPLVFWDDQFCDELCRRGFHVIRFDARDTGRSSRIDSPVPSQVTELLALLQAGQIAPPYGLEDLADDAIALLDALVPGRPAHLLGISQGGAVAQLMVLRAPNRVASLSLIASYTSDPASPPPDPNTMAALLTPIATDREGMVARELLIYRLTGSRSRPASEAWLRQRAERLWAYGFHPQGFIRHLLAVVTAGNRRPALERLRVPTVVIHGSEDPIVPPPVGRDLAAAIPGAKLVIVEGMGHDLPPEFWPPVTSAVTAQLSPGPATGSSRTS